MQFRRISLKWVFIIFFVLLLIILLFKIFKIDLSSVLIQYKAYIGILFIMSVIVIAFFVLINRHNYVPEDLTLKAWNYARDWLMHRMGTDIEPKFEDVWIKEGYYGTPDRFERFYGFSVVRKGTQERILFVVGTKPLRISAVTTTHISDDTDPFTIFFEELPTPVGGMQSRSYSLQPNLFKQDIRAKPNRTIIKNPSEQNQRAMHEDERNI